MTFAWSQELETGNVTIDNQHKQLIDALNALFYACRSGKGHEEVERTMDFLLGYTIKHFADEEELQLRHDYPEYLVHRQFHIGFKDVAQKLRQELLRDGPTDALVKKAYVALGDWLVNHIKGEDFKMAAYVQNRSQT